MIRRDAQAVGDLLLRDSEMAERFRALDWASTPLGPPATWPQSLRLAVGICLNSRFPMFVWWGPDLINIYNDAYIPVLGRRHPRGFGVPARPLWEEIWPVIGPQADAVMQRGEATWNERVLLVMERNGFTEDTWFTWSYSPIPDEAGGVGGLFCACTEDTGRVLAERERDRLTEQRQEREARLRRIVGGAKEYAIVELDRQGNITYWNSGAERLMGWPESEILGKPAAVFFTPEDRAKQAPHAELERALATGRVEDERWHLRRDGSRFWGSGLVTPLTTPGGDGPGAVTGFVKVFQDRTAQRAAAHALHESEQRFRAWTTASSDVIYAMSPDWTEMRHLRGREFIADTPEPSRTWLHKYIHPEDQSRVTEAIAHAVRTKGVFELEHRVQRPDGTLGWTFSRAVPILNTEGEIVEWFGAASDVTDRKQIEEALQQSERRFRETADTAPAMLWITNPTGYCTYLSRGWYEFTGQKESEGHGLGWTSAIHPDEREEAGRAFIAASDARGPYAVDFRLRRTDGVYRWVLDAGRPYFDAAGEFRGFVGSVIDIDDRKRAEEALQASETRYRSLFDTIDEGFCVIEFLDGPHGPLSDYVHVEANPAYERHAGIAGVVGQKVRDMVPHEADGWVELYRNVLLTGEPIRFQRELVSTGRYLELSAFRMGPVDRRQVAVLFQDVTERKRVEAALRESEGRFRQIADTMAHMVWVTLPDGYHEWYNKRWYEFTGVPAGSTDGQGWNDMFHPDDREMAWARWRHALATGELYEIEYRLRHHGGGYRWVLGRALPIRDAGGRIERWFGTCTDIDDLKRAQAAREQVLEAERAARTEAERVGRMKDEFLATLSHELRTPLNAILGWSQILGHGSTDAEDVRQGIAVIERNARAQAQLIEDLLDMSRIVSGNIRLDVQRVSLPDVIEAAMDTVRPAAELKRVRLVKVLDPIAGPVAGDPHRLQQVVWNLLSNAVKFTPPGGKVEILLERVNSHLELSVSDTGQGIRPEFMPHVFERFQQADGGTTRKHGGLGLGLAITKQLVELHGGSVRAKSPGEGQGATFTVHLPLTILKQPDELRVRRRHPTAGDAPARKHERQKLTGVRVLVVDDEPDARELVRRVLVECEAEVTVAGSAKEALAVFEEARPDLVVSDIGMPDVDGYDLIRAVRVLGTRRGGRVPAVALTAFARSEDRARALRAGYQAHVAKPVDPDELVATVAALAGRSSGDGEADERRGAGDAETP